MVPIKLFQPALIPQKGLLLIFLKFAFDLIQKIVEIPHLLNNLFSLELRIRLSILLDNLSKRKVAPSLLLHPLITIGHNFARFL